MVPIALLAPRFRSHVTVANIAMPQALLYLQVTARRVTTVPLARCPRLRATLQVTSAHVVVIALTVALLLVYALRVLIPLSWDPLTDPPALLALMATTVVNQVSLSQRVSVMVASTARRVKLWRGLQLTSAPLVVIVPTVPSLRFSVAKVPSPQAKAPRHVIYALQATTASRPMHPALVSLAITALLGPGSLLRTLALLVLTVIRATLPL